MTTETQHGASRFAALPTAAESAVLAVIAVLGAVNLPTPFWGDQALFAVFARGLDDGAVLYRDLWDLKQPAIYYFYLAGGRLFGFDEVGVHALELVYLLAFSWVLLRTGGAFLERRPSRLVLPLLAVGLYCVIAEERQMTQVEILIAFPLYLAFWFSLGRPGAWRSGGCLFVSGLTAAVVASFKLLFTPIVGAFWVAALALRLRQVRGGRLREALRFAAPLAGGFALPTSAYLLHAHLTGTLELVWWTWFVFPTQALGVAELKASRLISSAGWFAESFAPAIGLAIVTGIAALRGRRRNRFVAAAALWLLVGLGIIVAETWWWRYYLLLIVPPLGMLAAAGVDELLGLRRPARIALAVIALGLGQGAFASFADKVATLREHGLALAAADRAAYQRAVHSRYRILAPEVEFIRERVASGTPIYVFGEPTLLYLARLPYAIPINGWSLEEWSPELWRRAVEQLQAARPEYVFVRSFFVRRVRRAPELVALLTRHYDAVRLTRSGVWYRSRAADGG